MVLFEDECHVRHKDCLGTVWAAKGERVRVGMVNERNSKTFYGALDLLSRKFHVHAYERADTASTIAYLEWLVEKQYRSAKRIIEPVVGFRIGDFVD